MAVVICLMWSEGQSPPTGCISFAEHRWHGCRVPIPMIGRHGTLSSPSCHPSAVFNWSTTPYGYPRDAIRTGRKLSGTLTHPCQIECSRSVWSERLSSTRTKSPFKALSWGRGQAWRIEFSLLNPHPHRLTNMKGGDFVLSVVRLSSILTRYQVYHDKIES